MQLVITRADVARLQADVDLVGITRADVVRLQADVAKLQASPPPPPPPPLPPPSLPPPPSGRAVVALEVELEPELELELEAEAEAEAEAGQHEALRCAAALLNGVADSAGGRALRAILASAEPDDDEEAPYPPQPPPVLPPPAPPPSDPWAARPSGLGLTSDRDSLVDAARSTDLFDEAAARRQLRTLQQAQRLARQMRNEMEAEAAAAAESAARLPRPGAAASGIAEWMEKYTAGWREAQLSTASPGPSPPPPSAPQLQLQPQRRPSQPRGGGARGLPFVAEAGLPEAGPAVAVPYASRGEQVRARRLELERATLVRRVALIEKHATVAASSGADS